MKRKIILLGFSFLFLMLPIFGCHHLEISSSKEQTQENVVRIGYQKNGPLVILKSLGTLEKNLKEQGYKVEWREFQEGPALVEALSAGSIDMGRTGNSPVIFAQASRASFVIVAAGKSKYHGSGILVPEGSSIKQLKDLKGKEIGFAKGSSSHYLLVKALEKVDLKYNDITPAFLSPGDARVAFEQGSIDAMVVWDPFTASVEVNSNGRMIADGEGLTTDRDFFIATNSFAENHTEIVNTVIEEVTVSSEWANNNVDELVKMLGPILNIDKASIKRAAERRIYGIEDVTGEMIEEQQEIADTFFDLQIIPKQIDVRDVME